MMASSYSLIYKNLYTYKDKENNPFSLLGNTVSRHYIQEVVLRSSDDALF